MTFRGIWSIAIASALWSVLAAQTPSAPAFEVASIKPNTSGTMRVNTLKGARYTATLTLLMLIRQAYQVERSQIVGGPGWLSSDLFDVTAKAPDDTPPAQTPLLLRALLADRFKLTVHTETRESPIFALVLARKDGRLGPDMRRVTDVAVPSAPRLGPGTIAANGVSMAQLAVLFEPVAGRRVVDRTGLRGVYDVSLHWTPSDSTGPSFLTVIQEQLGLKLNVQRGEVTVLVIDHAERPTED